MATQKLDNFESITKILVRRGLAGSLEQAVEMVRAGKVVVAERDYTQRPCPLRPTIISDPNARYRFNEPIVAPSKLRGGKRARVPRREFEQGPRGAASALALTPQDCDFLKSLRISTDDDEPSL